MKVIVTGAAGHLGSLLVQRLLDSNVEVIGIDKLLYGNGGIAPLLSNPNFRLEKLDITEEFADNLDGVDFIVHLAALVGPVCEIDKKLSWKTNCDATEKICGWAKDRNAKLIFASTCSNYGIFDGIADEDSPLQPLGTYAETKVAAEKIVQESLEENGVTLRFGTMAGLSPRPRFDTMLNQFTYEAYRDGKIECRQPQARRPFISVSDAVRAIETLILNWPKIDRRCYNAVGFNTTKKGLAEVIQSYTGCEIIEKPESQDRRDYSVSAERIEAELGFKADKNISDCVEEVYLALKSGEILPSKEHYNVQ